MKKIKGFFVSLNLRASDLLLLIGFAPVTVFLMFGQIFMQKINPDEVGLKLPVIIPLFILLLITWGLYIFIESKFGNKTNKYINVIFILLAVIGIVGILIQPINFSINMIDKNGEPALINFTISTTHRTFFVIEIITILLFVYISIFVFPKRFTNVIVLEVIGYLVLLGCFALIIYSYIAEGANYIPFLKALFGDSIYYINVYAVKSFIIHKNAYGMTLLIGIVFCFINHSIRKKWFYFLIAFFLYGNMVFTFCKTSLIIAPIISVIYLFYYLVTSLKTGKSIYKWLLGILISLVVTGISILTVSFVTKGKVFGSLYQLISNISDKETIGSREMIWNNTYQLLSSSLPLSILFGRGFGLINEMLLPMNIVNGDRVLSFPTHNSYLNLLAEGGLLYVLFFLMLFGYAIYIAIKCYKKNRGTTIAILLGLTAFSFYSLIETIHYLMYAFMFLLFVLYNVSQHKELLKDD